MTFNDFLRQQIEKNFNSNHHDLLEVHYFELITGRKTKCSKFDLKFIAFVKAEYKKINPSF